MAKRFREDAVDCLTPGKYTVFCGPSRLFRGDLEQAVRKTKRHIDATPTEDLRRIAFLDDATSQPLDIDFRGSEQQVVDRLADHPLLQFEPQPPKTRPAAPRGRGRPRLGVVSREVSLLPRHWRWLAEQGGASATLRRLVEQARRESQAKDRVRQTRDAANRFMWETGSDRPLPNFEETSRALYRDQLSRIERLTEEWPEDIREHLLRLVRRLKAAKKAE